MTVLNCNTFCFLVDKRSKEDGDFQSSSGSELPRAVHLQRFESVPGQLSCTLSTPCSGLWKLEGKKKKKKHQILGYILVHTCTCSISAGEQNVDVWSRLERTCPHKSILEGGEIAYNSVFGFRKYCYQLPVQSKAQFKAAEKQAIQSCQSNAAVTCSLAQTWASSKPCRACTGVTNSTKGTARWRAYLRLVLN